MSSKHQHRIVAEPIHDQRYFSTTGQDERITLNTESSRKIIGDIGRNNDYRASTDGGILAISGFIDDGSHLVPPRRASCRVGPTPPSTSRPFRTAETDESKYDQNAGWKSIEQFQRRCKRARGNRDEEDEANNQLDPSLIDEDNLTLRLGSVTQETSKRRKLSTTQQPPHHPRLFRELPTQEDISARVTRPGFDIESASISQISNCEGDRHRFTARESPRGSTYDVGDTRKYLRCYITNIYPLCPLEICNDYFEDLVLHTLSFTSDSEQSKMTNLCVYSMLALGARYSMHSERAREFFLSAKEQLGHLPEGEKNEYRLAEGLNCMAMYAMGVESSAEVLSYLNRALDICSHNGIENGPVYSNCLNGKYLLMLARVDENADLSEHARIELRERAWLWYNDEYERSKEATPYTVSQIMDGTYPVSLAAMRTIDNCTSVMVRITSGIIALGWGWQNWKNLQSDSETQTKETILGQHDYWLQWLDRVMERVNETQPPGAEIPEVIVTDLRLNLYALYAACYMAVDMNDSALQWAFKYVRDLRRTVLQQSGNLLFPHTDVIFRICATMKCGALLDDIAESLLALLRTIPSLIFLKRRCDKLRAELQQQQNKRSYSFMPADPLEFTRKRDSPSLAFPFKSAAQLEPLNPDTFLFTCTQQLPQRPPPHPPPPQPQPTQPRCDLSDERHKPPSRTLVHHDYPSHHSSPQQISPCNYSYPTTTTTTTTTTSSSQARSTTTTTTTTSSPLSHSSPLPTSPDTPLALLQNLQQQIHQQNKAAAKAKNAHIPPRTNLNTSTLNLGSTEKIPDSAPPDSSRPPSSEHNSDIYDLINHDDEPPDKESRKHQHEGVSTAGNECLGQSLPRIRDDSGMTDSLNQLRERRCLECNTTDTPEWRRGPTGPHTLCNACGLRWARTCLNSLKRREPTHEEKLFSNFSIRRKIT